MDDTFIERARQIVKRFYPEMRPDYSGRRVDLALAARAEAFEEAAKIAEEYDGLDYNHTGSCAEEIAAALRAQAGEKP